MDLVSLLAKGMVPDGDLMGTAILGAGPAWSVVDSSGNGCGGSGPDWSLCERKQTEQRDMGSLDAGHPELSLHPLFLSTPRNPPKARANLWNFFLKPVWSFIVFLVFRFLFIGGFKMNFIIFLIMCMAMGIVNACAPESQRTEEGIGSPRTGVTGDLEPPDIGYWKPNSIKVHNLFTNP